MSSIIFAYDIHRIEHNCTIYRYVPVIRPRTGEHWIVKCHYSIDYPSNMLFLLLVLFHLLNYSGKRKCDVLFWNYLNWKSNADLCSIEYLIVDPNHSFCSTAFPQVIDETMSLSEQEYILEVHNHQRQLTRGTNVEKMVELILFSSNFDWFSIEISIGMKN